MRAMASDADQAISAAISTHKHRSSLLFTLARIFTDSGDTASLKRLLIPCAYYLDAAYQACELLAQLYPQHLTAIAEAVEKSYSVAEDRLR